jgi:glycine/D-amino acid oxidase-like deaminating enzyme
MSNSHTAPLWVTARPSPKYPRLDRDLRVDVVVVGGGLTGVTAAYLLKRAGRSVALIERGRCGQGETRLTTAHVTAVTDTSLSELVDALGRDHAQAVWEAGFAAISRIRAIVRDERINCQFAWVPGWLYASRDDDQVRARVALQREASIANDLGVDAAFVERVPGLGRPGVVFDSQARFDPLAYIEVLASRIDGDGSYVFEDSEADAIATDPVTVRAGAGTITADFVVVATHQPIWPADCEARVASLQESLRPHWTYAVRATSAPCAIMEGLYWESRTAYDYFRVDRRGGHDELVFGGADRPIASGEADEIAAEAAAFAEVEARLRAIVRDARITHRWSGVVIETRDGLPYIGEMGPACFGATGFAGNGMTFATLAGMMAADAATGRANPWRDLFDINRTSLATGAWNYGHENRDYPSFLRRPYASLD